MKVYLAAPYSAKDQITQYAAQLKDLGVGVTSSWLDEPHKPTTQMHELTHEEHLVYAEQDVLDVCAADAMVFFTDPTKTIVRAGRHVEFGMVVILNKLRGPMPIYVIGPEYENIFHHLPNVRHFENWEQFVSMLIMSLSLVG